MRYIWDLERQYFPPGRFPWPLSWYVRATCARLRHWDAASNANVHTMLANSRHVAERIRRHWGREAEVVYPGIDLERFRPGAGARDYFLLAGAFAPYKHGELAIEACRRLGLRLVVAGSGPMEHALRRQAGPGVEFLGWVSDDRLAELYRGARALLFPGEEDLGLMPVEALASGCPVVAFGRGGALETVGAGVSDADLARLERGGAVVVRGGVLFGQQTVESLCEGIRLLERHPREPRELRELALPFSAEHFDQRFLEAFERGRRAWDPGGAAAFPSRSAMP
jgi:glycosyltransferase involved in cell wall biosynthesis